MNANPATLDYLIPTTLSVDSDRASLESIDYPEGEMMSFEFSDQELSVYDGESTISARLNVSSGYAGETVPVTFRYQACDDRRCLPPETVEKSVRLNR